MIKKNRLPAHDTRLIRTRMIQGLRLQPLVDLHNHQTFGMEVLSQLTLPNLTEFFFKKMPAEAALSLFLLQAETVSRYYPGETLLINLPIRTLLDTELTNRLLLPRSDLCATVAIEIQDPDYLIGMSGTRRQSLIVTLMALREAGWKLWMDDLTPALVSEVGSLGIIFDGVKIDRHEMLRPRMPDSLSQLVTLASGLGRQILVEGVESQEDLAHACKSGAGIGQGFYWPETILPLNMGKGYEFKYPQKETSNV